MNKDISGFADAVKKVMTEVELSPEMSLEDMYNKLQHIIMRALKKCGALSKKKSHKNHKPWFTSDIRDLIKQRDTAKLTTQKKDKPSTRS